MWTKRHSPLPLLILACLPVSAATANAQDRPKGELFVGFSGRTNGDPVLRGWNASAALHINKTLAIVADISGEYGARSQVVYTLSGFLLGNPNSFQSTNPNSHRDTSLYTFLAGPQYSQRLAGRTSIFVHTLFGASRLHLHEPTTDFIFDANGILVTSSPTSPTRWFDPLAFCLNCRNSFTKIGFSFGAGGGLDVTVARHWAVRVLQADYINKPDVLGQGSNDFRLSSGLIYQW